ncbi:TDT family transporter SCDLUD_002623 [Saccharomycodes ludwigii]|uniref:TDT family transporter n=1 Tax=Saccharomycodes ludwigii TaxID=36035 RepID=UPI001E8B8189|nr:hypothetical protein SCDLUD_002623 [Saccharomycodes ludwigii]KAH3901141.1 hypothetical protein SCDLUD_002623 [Saccharomycodes ludwigii]
MANTGRKKRIYSLVVSLIDEFAPFWFVTVMGTGISSSILHEFPYPAKWLRICSYIMFAICCLLFLIFQTAVFLNMYRVIYVKRLGVLKYVQRYFVSIPNNLFWGTYAMGFCTIINYMYILASNEASHSYKQSKNLIIAVYVLWWVDVTISLGTAWVITFLCWKYTHQDLLSKNLQSFLLLPIIPIVVVSSSSGQFTMSELFTQHFNRNIQLLTLVITALLWLHAIALVFLVLSVYFWNLYINGIPDIMRVFTCFLCIGPMGQGSYGVQLLSDNILKYIKKYHANTGDEREYLSVLAVGYSFKVFGLILALLLMSCGIFFTFYSFASIASYYNTIPLFNSNLNTSANENRIYHYHKGWWAMTFPLGTMALSTKEIWIQYDRVAPIGAFRVLSVIYSGLCVISTIFCLLGCLKIYVYQWIKDYNYHTTKNNRKSGNNEEQDQEAEYNVARESQNHSNTDTKSDILNFYPIITYTTANSHYHTDIEKQLTTQDSINA